MSENAHPSHGAAPDDPIAGAYETIRTLGQDGMGVGVVRGENLTSDNMVAPSMIGTGCT